MPILCTNFFCIDIADWRQRIEEFKMQHNTPRPLEKYANTPDLWRVTCEPSGSKDPYKVKSTCFL